MNKWYRQFCSYTKYKKLKYQKEGIQFCEFIEKNSFYKSGIIADEMGLGKTTIIIGLLVRRVLNKSLIVVPKVLLETWKEAIFTRLRIHPIIIYSLINKGREDLISKNNIILTTYDYISQSNIFNKFLWDRVIFDEGHHLRNHKTNRSQSALSIRSIHKWILTGTPIHNSKKDIISLCLHLGIPKCKLELDYKEIIKTYILKRTKKQVNLKIPKPIIIEKTINFETKEEKRLSSQIHSCLKESELNEFGRRIIKKNQESFKLAFIIRARQICTCPPLLKNLLPDDKGTDSVSKLNTIISNIDNSKLDKRPKILFCNFRGEIDYLKFSLIKKGIKTQSIDGRIKDSNEKNKILSSKENYILILQFKTCSEGLNLQRYKDIIIVSPHWNPCVEKQAIARSYRLGQRSNVRVIKYIMEDLNNNKKNIESYCLKIQTKKKRIIELFNQELNID